MKRFIEVTVQMKLVWGIFCTTGIIIYSIIGAVLGESAMKLTDIWLLTVVTFALSLIYVLIWGEFILSSFSTKAKMLVLYLINYGAFLLYCSMIGLLSISNLQNVGVFTLGYTLLFFMIMSSFHSYYKLTGEELNDKLTAYKQRRSMK